MSASSESAAGVAPTSAGAPSIPLLDLGRLESGEAVRADFFADLRDAARDVGFFYVSGHGIRAELLRELLSAMRRFFALPDADKRGIDIVKSPHFRGYTRVGGERTRGLEDWREQLDIGAEQTALVLAKDDPAWWRLKGPNQWPVAVPELREAALEWQARGTQVLVRVLRAFALALGQPEDALDSLVRDEPHVRSKLIRYPGRDRTSSDQGVGAHKDSCLLSMLLQDGESGLEVQTERGWVAVPPRPGTLVVNIGELLELISDGYLRATVHRVVSPAAGRERLSAAFFLGARLDATVPLLRLPPQLAAQARGPERDPNNPLLREAGWNALKTRLRSHPDVARRHYADVLNPPGTPPPAG